jgi:hypothetical protein
MAMKKNVMKSMLATDVTCESSSLCERGHRFDDHLPALVGQAPSESALHAGFTPLALKSLKSIVVER